MAEKKISIVFDADTSGFTAGVKSMKTSMANAVKAINAEIGNIGESFSTIGDTIASGGSALTKAITAPVAGFVAGVVKEYAGLEQAVGGIETMFDTSATAVIKNSSTAYKRAGTSAVDYMEQITSFSASLLQSTGGDTERAAAVADMAMVDMSDNANKFGTNIESIQNAYQGFAKGNYTMLDNLKLGFGGTKEEMARLLDEAGKISGIEYNMDNLDDVYEAIHVIQNEMGVTGTTAEEAEKTVSGAWGMMKASVMDFLGGMGTADADIQTLISNMGESFVALKENIVGVLQNIWDNLPLTDVQKFGLGVATAFGPVLLIIGKVVSTIGGMMTTFQSLSGVFSALKGSLGVVQGAFTGLTLPILAIVAGVALLIGAFVSLWQNNEEFRDRIVGIFEEVKAVFQGFADGIVERLNALGFDFQSFKDVLLTVWNSITEFLAPIFIVAFELIKETISVALEVILGIIDVFINLFTGNWEGLGEALLGIITTAWEFIKNVFTLAIEAIVGTATVFISWFGTSWSELWESVKTKASEIWTSIKTYFSTTFENIKTTAQTKWTEIKTKIVNSLAEAWESLKTKVSDMKTGIATRFSEIVTNAKTKWAEAKSNIVTPISEAWESVKTKVADIKNGVTTKFSEVSTDVKTKWSEIKSAITTPIDDAKEAVRKAIEKIKGFMDFDWELPKLKMPSFSVSGKFGLNPISVPSFGISWHQDGGIFKGSKDGTVVGLGENHGDEAIVPLSNKSRMKPFASAIAGMMPKQDNSDNTSKGDTIITGNTFVVREEADIKKIAQELKRLDDRESRGRGRR